MQFYEALRERFGPQQWWPADGPLEVCLGAILTQNTNWRNVEKAIANLRAVGALDLAALAAMPPEELAEQIRPAGYYNVKARRLKNFIAAVWDFGGEDLAAFLDGSAETLRRRLLAIKGIGRETADSIILYAARKCTFVIDAYTCRVLLRHGLIGPEDDYESVKALLESSLEPDVELFNEFHALFVTVGKGYCKPVARCTGCPLEPFEHDPNAGME
jgi:endonuclease III related protein